MPFLIVSFYKLCGFLIIIFYYINLKCCLSISIQTSIASALIKNGLAKSDSCGFWHVEVYFEKFLTAIVCAKDRAVDFNNHCPQKTIALMVMQLAAKP